jgi:acyl-CoA synthetase (AMP-forming)/AMP-acid ligase II
VNVADYLLECADPRTTALISDSRQFSYEEPQDAATRVAADLIGAGGTEGDRIELLARNALSCVAADPSILRLGAVVVPFSTTSTRKDLGAPHALAECRVLCAETPPTRGHPARLESGPDWISKQVLIQPGPPD